MSLSKLDHQQRHYVRLTEGGMTYVPWSLNVKNAIISEDPRFWDHLDPALPAPAQAIAAAAITLQRKAEAHCMRCILTSIDEANMTRVQALAMSPAHDASRAVWVRLRDDHTGASMAVQATTRGQLQRATYNPPMRSWLQALQAIYNRHVLSNGPMTPREFLEGILALLPGTPAFVTFRTMVRARIPGPTTTVEHVFRELIDLAEHEGEEAKRAPQGDHVQALPTTTAPDLLGLIRDAVTTALAASSAPAGRNPRTTPRSGDTRRNARIDRTPDQKAQLQDDIKNGVCNRFRHGACDKGATCKYSHRGITQANAVTTEPATFSFALATTVHSAVVPVPNFADVMNELLLFYAPLPIVEYRILPFVVERLHERPPMTLASLLASATVPADYDPASSRPPEWYFFDVMDELLELHAPAVRPYYDPLHECAACVYKQQMDSVIEAPPFWRRHYVHAPHFAAWRAIEDRRGVTDPRHKFLAQVKIGRLFLCRSVVSPERSRLYPAM